MISKILIANRGEIALRIIRACKEMGIKTVAVYSEADELSLHTRFADEAVCIGPPISSNSYLNIPSIISAAELTNSDAIHPGYGFLSENSDFANICTENSVTFIGPNSKTIDLMGDKSQARKTVQALGVSIIPGSKDVIQNIEECREVANNIGYPVPFFLYPKTGHKPSFGSSLVGSKTPYIHLLSFLDFHLPIICSLPPSFFQKYCLWLYQFIPSG